jgi:hypothetical protein
LLFHDAFFQTTKDNKSVAKTHYFAPKSLFLLRGMAQVRKNARDLRQGELLTN